MYHVVVADDEHKIRRNIISKGKWEENEFCVVSEAKDGDELCDILKSQNIQLIITDLKMPGISEEELLKYLNKNHPDIYVIVISGYDDYKYMKQAINTKVYDYILKPVNAEILNDTLLRVKNQIKSDQSNIDNLCRNRKIAAESIFNQFLCGQSVSQVEICESLNINDLSDIDNSTVAVIQPINLASISKSQFNSDMTMLMYGIENILNEIIGKEQRLFKTIKNQIIIIFDHEINQQQIEKILNNAVYSLNECMDINLIISVGKKCNNYKDIPCSYKLSDSLLSLINLKKEKIVFYNNINNVPIPQMMPLSLDYVEAGLKSGDLKLAVSEITKYYQLIGQQDYISIKLIQSLNKSMLELLCNVFPQSTKAYSAEFNSLCDNIKEQTDLIDISARICNYIQMYCFEEIFNMSSNIIKDIKEHIDKSKDFDISLNELSSKFGISKQYLIKKFKEEYEMTPYEYIMNKKINFSMQLLIENKLSIAQIVEKLNFSDASHFSKTFKKHMGVCPQKYKENLK